jgi:hypothetical protein
MVHFKVHLWLGFSCLMSWLLALAIHVARRASTLYAKPCAGAMCDAPFWRHLLPCNSYALQLAALAVLVGLGEMAYGLLKPSGCCA